jgi:hypothetical protein
MRTKGVFLLASLLILGLLAPTGASAKRVMAFGSLTITKSDGTALSTVSPPLVGVAVLANPGLEKTISIPIPQYTFPVFVNEETDQPGDNDFDTVFAVTNVSGSPLMIKVTLHDANGMVMSLTTDSFTLGANATLTMRLSSLLP